MCSMAVIPARGGSKGLPGKNIRLLGGYPLIAYSIVAGIMAKQIDRVIVSTDSEEIAGIAKRFGAEVPFLRPNEYATDNSADIDFVLHLINWLAHNEGRVPEYLVHLRPTTPLRDPLIIDEAIYLVKNSMEASSLRSAHPAPESPFKWFVKKDNGYFASIISGLSSEAANMPRQGFPEVYIPDGYVDVLKTSFIQDTNTMHGDRMVGFVSPFCCEVDTASDFEYLEYDLQKNMNPVYDYLKQNY